MTTSFTSAIGRKVIAANSADDVGKVKTFVVDQAGTSITQIQVTGRKRNAELVNWQDVEAFGPDALIIKDVVHLHEAPDERTEEMVRGTVEYLDSLILSDDGEELGTVSDVHFDEKSGEIVGVLGETVGRVEGDKIASLGSYALVIRA